MQLAALDLPQPVKEALAAHGIRELFPSQVEAVPIALSGKSLVLAVPTASGKSLVAYLALLKHAAAGGKGIYIVPLRALAAEKFSELRDLARPLGLKVALSMGDLDADELRLGDFDVIVCTSEKADSLLRQRTSWLSSIACIVADEVHLINDGSRGPTLEVILTRFKTVNPRAQIVALSATIANSKDLAEWLNAAHVTSDWRPVALTEGVLAGNVLRFKDGKIRTVEGSVRDPVVALVAESLDGGGQCLVFVNTRRSTEALAVKLSAGVKRGLTAADLQRLGALAEALVPLRTQAAASEKKLADCVGSGVAFHHAGLTNDERAAVEQAFKDRLLRVIVATPTLAAGVNLPARRVIIRDLWRYEEDAGQQPIPVLEYKQMAGRAGRPRYDKVGEALSIARDEDAASEAMERYLLGEPEQIRSKLGNEAALRVHILSSVSSGFVRDRAGLREFLESTFFGFHQDYWTVEQEAERVLTFLTNAEMVNATTATRATAATTTRRTPRTKKADRTDDAFEATPFGKLVSRLYIDPLSGVMLRESLEAMRTKDATDLAILYAAARTPDVRPLFLRRDDDWIETAAAARGRELLTPIGFGEGYEFFLGEFKTALLLHDWIDETPDDVLEKRYGAYPGDVRNKVDGAEWLIHGMREMACMFNPGASAKLSRLLVRLRQGVKEELLPLVRFRGVGRVRARSLFKAGYRTEEHLRAATVAALAKVPMVGPRIAASIKEELGQYGAAGSAGAADTADAAGQSKLTRFGRRKR